MFAAARPLPAAAGCAWTPGRRAPLGASRSREGSNDVPWRSSSQRRAPCAPSPRARLRSARRILKAHARVAALARSASSTTRTRGDFPPRPAIPLPPRPPRGTSIRARWRWRPARRCLCRISAGDARGGFATRGHGAPSRTRATAHRPSDRATMTAMVEKALDDPIGQPPLREKIRGWRRARAPILGVAVGVSIPLPTMRSPDVRQIILEQAERRCARGGRRRARHPVRVLRRAEQVIRSWTLPSSTCAAKLFAKCHPRPPDQLQRGGHGTQRRHRRDRGRRGSS